MLAEGGDITGWLTQGRQVPSGHVSSCPQEDSLGPHEAHEELPRCLGGWKVCADC